MAVTPNRGHLPGASDRHGRPTYLAHVSSFLGVEPNPFQLSGISNLLSVDKENVYCIPLQRRVGKGGERYCLVQSNPRALGVNVG